MYHTRIPKVMLGRLTVAMKGVEKVPSGNHKIGIRP